MRPRKPILRALVTPAATARGLRALATSREPYRAIGGYSAFRIGSSWFHNDDHEAAAPDRRVTPDPETGSFLIPPHPITPMELIDDACDFERIATKLEALK